MFRDGRNAGLFVTADTNMKQLVGESSADHGALAKADDLAASRPSVGPASSTPILSLSNVSSDRLKQITLILHKHEIRGLAGLIGSGRTEILKAIFGLLPRDFGVIEINGVPRVNDDPAVAIERGVALVPEDRHVQGLVLDHSIERNLTLPRLPNFSSFGWLRQRAASDPAKSSMRQLAVKAPGSSTTVKNLSGGNQQKVVFAKWNDPQPRVLLLDEPTVGVDVGAREEIYRVIRAAATAGTGVLVVSSDLGELISLCDRISVVVDGRVIKTIERDSFGSTEDLHHMIQLSQYVDEIT